MHICLLTAEAGDSYLYCTATSKIEKVSLLDLEHATAKSCLQKFCRENEKVQQLVNICISYLHWWSMQTTQAQIRI